MILINGRRQRVHDIADRAFAYGDGLFETVAVVHSKPRLWNLHLKRLYLGCDRLGLPRPDEEQLLYEAEMLCKGVTGGVLKLIWSAGVGGRGFRRAGAEPTRVLIRSELPRYPKQWWRDGVAVRWCQLRLARQPQLAGIKHLNRLEQVLARAEWETPSVAEGILLSDNGAVVEGTMTNLFIVRGNVLYTPALTEAGVAGVMREHLLALAAALELQTQVTRLEPEDVVVADEVFVSNSLIGLWPVTELDGTPYPVGPVSQRLLVELRAREDIPDWFTA
ncbi:aminodeoxychorismate lyase [Alkalilimnicola ehrlichii]|uniref:Aminodeoxychorismate lyase n=1 Tax=Alkalilimnicola ehrlichii TaxID=351052 RepID=A0A3E0WNR4_9GAMM|nr:aminodeoxychorismate lyase [Alkalilimnicola ehrlichii]RFA29971.1 aminodeoxychorismate lyase [Alkalilimnicola ehrlichii]RFA33791.1 aminodeoxychorismate lyase [Alkalilimnicola ehrlichii]